MTEEKASVPGEDPGTTPTAVEVDFDRILAGDDAYTKEVSAQLTAVEDATVTEPEKTTESEEVPDPKAAKSEAATPALDPEEVIETIIFRGKQEPVLRKDQRTLLQKGRYMDYRMQELSPMIQLAKEAPELLELGRTPEGRKKIVERIRREEQAKAVDDDSDDIAVDGYDKADVKAVDKILRARLEKLGVNVKNSQESNKVTPEQEKAQADDLADLTKQTRITLQSLQSLDPHYEKNMELLKSVVQEAERTMTTDQFQQFFQNVNDPRRIDHTTGRPIFLNFYADVNAERIRRENLGSKPAVPNLPERQPRAASGRMVPGAASSPTNGPIAKDLTKLPQAEFDKAFAEALAR